MSEPAAGFVPPMLARPGDVPTGEGWWAEVKWDGVRIVARVEGDDTRLWGRRGLARTATWPEFGGLADALRGRSAVVDGEAVVSEAGSVPRFDLVQRRMNVTDPVRARRLALDLPGVFMIFDLLELDGVSLMGAPLEERRAALDTVIASAGAIQVPAVYDDPAGLLAVVAEKGMEGVVSKRSSSTYLPGRRSESWIKTKATKEDEFVIGGWFEGTGARASTFGSVALGVRHGDERSDNRHRDRLAYVGAAGSGFGAADLERLSRVFELTSRTQSPFVDGDVPPGLHPVDPLVSVRVRYGEWTPDGVLRHPVVLGVSSVRGVEHLSSPGEE